VTVYEHVMVGVSLALAAGLHRCQGWGIVAMAGGAAALPDWDGLTILFGGGAYDRGHRIWGHNIPVAASLGLASGAGGYLATFSRRLQRATSALPRPFSAVSLAIWTLVGLVAALTHLGADIVYSGRQGMATWPVQLFWPFSSRGWAWPLMPWGDLGATLIFIVEMFLRYRWPRRAELIAAMALAAVVVYVGMWGLASCVRS
jgi:hypothetical protein